ncbi:zinc finger, CCHC-type containing protein [Tanacetum coccineum]
MYFLLSNISVVYVLTTLISEDDGDDAIMEQIRKRAKWDNDDYDSLKAKYMAEDASSKKFFVSNFTNYKMTDSRPVMEQYNELLNFKNTLKHRKEELTLVELGNHLHIEESLKVHDGDMPKGNNVAGLQLNIVNDNIASAFMSTSKLNDSILWHARLGHVHFKRMQDMSKDVLIPAFDMDAEKCKTCMLTKITKKQFQNIKRETEVLELIHSDLCDLHATPSLGNKKYFVTFIDDASRFCYVYLLHTKDEALDKFKVFKTEFELQQGSLIKRFMTDRGCEYIDTLYFQTESRVLRAVVRLPDPKLKTLDEKDIEYILVGYAEHSKGFRLFVIEPNESVSINSIIESRDAIFDENIFSSVPRPSLRIPNGTGKIGDSGVPEEVTKEVVQQPERELRKSKRNRTPRNFGPEFQLYLIEETRDVVSDQHSYYFNVEDDPKTFDEAMKSHDVAFLKEVINNEMDSIMGNNTWVLADLPLGCKWIYKRKLKVDRTIEKFKARLVIQGFRQKLGINYFDTYAPVARISTIILLIAMTSIHNLIIHQMGVKTTFLNESEFVALAAAGKEAEWLEKLLLEIPLWSKPIAHISIRCDSAATLAKAYSQMYNGKSRHLGVRHSMIREPITNGVVSIEFVRS